MWISPEGTAEGASHEKIATLDVSAMNIDAALLTKERERKGKGVKT